MSTTHHLKTWPEFFEPLYKGEKTFELRYNDRSYRVGDVLDLQEFLPCRPCKARGHSDMPNGVEGYGSGICPECNGTGGRYTGRKVWRVVTYVLSEHVALQRGYAVLGLSI